MNTPHPRGSTEAQRQLEQVVRNGLGQQLTGTALLADLLQDKLQQKNLPETDDARRLVVLLDQARQQCRQLAGNLPPPSAAPLDLADSLGQLASTVAAADVECQFDCPCPIRLRDPAIANLLLQLTQEAVRQALRYSHCRRLALRLIAQGCRVRLHIRHDGGNWRWRWDSKPPGKGLQIIKGRLEALGGTLAVRSLNSHGASLTCVAPVVGRPSSDSRRDSDWNSEPERGASLRQNSQNSTR